MKAALNVSAVTMKLFSLKNPCKRQSRRDRDSLNSCQSSSDSEHFIPLSPSPPHSLSQLHQILHEL